MELRSDIAAAAARMTSGYEVQREIRQLAAYLRESETVHRLASGIYGAGPGLLAVTNHRVLLLRDGRSGQASEGFPLERLSVAEWSPEGVLGTVTISDSHSTAVLSGVPAAEGAEVVSYIGLLAESEAQFLPARRWATGSSATGSTAGASGSNSGSAVGSTVGSTFGSTFGSMMGGPGAASAESPAGLSASAATGVRGSTGVRAPSGVGSATGALAGVGSPTGLLGGLGSPTGALTGVVPAAPDGGPASPEATNPVGRYRAQTGPVGQTVPPQGGVERTHSVGEVPPASGTGAYPIQYAPSPDPGATADELTRGAVPVSVLARTGTIPAQQHAVEPPFAPADAGRSRRSRVWHERPEYPGAQRPDDVHSWTEYQVEPGGAERLGTLGSPELMVGEVPVSQLAAEETAALAAAEPPHGELSEAGGELEPETTVTDQAGTADADTGDDAPGDAEVGGRERPKPINWTAPSQARRLSQPRASTRSGVTRAVGIRPPVRVEATNKPASASPSGGPGRLARSKKWIWLGAGAAGLIGLAALGSAKLISTNQPLAAPVSPAPAAVDSTAGPVVTVTNVINGDTVEVSGQYTGVVEVLGIVTPRPDKNQCGASTAKAFAVKTLNNATVTLISDPSQPLTDRTGHRLAFLRLPNGADYSVLAVQAGMARYYESQPPVSTAADIKAAEAQAEKNHAGLWAAPCYGKFSSAGTSTSGGTGTSTSSGTGTSTGHTSTPATRSGAAESTGGTPGTGNG